MHPEILNKEQSELLTFIKKFNKSFYLVGGTAIALHLGHRSSIDFDLFTSGLLKKGPVRKKIAEVPGTIVKLFEDADQLHYIINGVKTTFFSFPYQVVHNEKLDNIITLPSLLDLAAMKAFALGRPAKWKDYVDLFFIIKYHYSINDISRQASVIFTHDFNQKLFREQLTFHKDIDYSEEVEYFVTIPGNSEIKAFLIEKAIDIF